MLRLNVGCGRTLLPDWINLDVRPLPGVDLVADLDGRGSAGPAAAPLPLPDGSVEEFLLSHVLEHIREPLPMMEELWRVAAPGARMTVRCPYGSSDDAWEDPTHVRAIFLQSFGYFSQPYYWRADYGYRGRLADGPAGPLPGHGALQPMPGRQCPSDPGDPPRRHDRAERGAGAGGPPVGGQAGPGAAPGPAGATFHRGAGCPLVTAGSPFSSSWRSRPAPPATGPARGACATPTRTGRRCGHGSSPTSCPRTWWSGCSPRPWPWASTVPCALQHYNEPLQDSRIAAFGRRARALGFPHVFICTNGDFITEAVAAELDGAFHELQVALYMDEPAKGRRQQWLATLFRETRLHFTGGGHIPTHFSPLFDVAALAHQNRIHPCGEPLRRLIINHRGDMLLCCDDLAGHFGLGNIRDHTVEQLWFGDRHQDLVLALQSSWTRTPAGTSKDLAGPHPNRSPLSRAPLGKPRTSPGGSA